MIAEAAQKWPHQLTLPPNSTHNENFDLMCMSALSNCQVFGRKATEGCYCNWDSKVIAAAVLILLEAVVVVVNAQALGGITFTPL